MEFRLTEEEERLRRSVEDFVRDELIPLEPKFANAPDIFEGTRWKSRATLSRDPEIKRYIGLMEGLEKKAEAKGLWYLDVPKQYDGMAVSNVAMIATTEELEKSSIPFELGNHVSNILYNCTGGQVERFLLPCIRGEKTSAFAASSTRSIGTSRNIPDCVGCAGTLHGWQRGFDHGCDHRLAFAQPVHRQQGSAVGP